ncbi:MAG TPA: DUF262 domain-containing protein [Solirubrobacterales bacterium]|nr:DUF262 domain-containing protein [Solirubrobacterales bacterium]
MIEPRLVTLGDLFADRSQYQVPIYQRPYVWGKEEQWMPLWEDLKDTAQGHLGGKVAPHFLGAIVIELISAQPGHVKEYSVIDGQQRLTTLQLLLAALGVVARESRPEQWDEVRKLLLNEGKHATGDLRFKILPGEHDRPIFKQVVAENGTVPEGEEGIPGAYHYFMGEIRKWVQAEESPERRALMLDALQEAGEGLLQVVSIQLDGSSDAQIIFETLNSRGADLTSLDLAKNAIFRLAEKEATEEGEVSELHATHWQPSLGDADYWLETVRQGRYTNERADLFLMHWLTMKIGKPARVQHLFADFRKEILQQEPAPTARELVVELSEDAKTFRSFDDFDEGSDEGRFFRRLRMMDTTTLLPVALRLFRSGELDEERRRCALRALESWLVRRMLLGATSAHYNRLLASLLETLNEQPSLEGADALVIESLRGYSNPTDTWPTDEQVLNQIHTRALYGWISHKRIRLLLEACELQLAASSKSEQLPFPEKLSIEHAMPQNWPKNWPLPAETEDEAAIAERNERINRLGNLTLVTSGLNSSLSDSAWPVKREALGKHSQLLVNQQLCANETWDDASIDARSNELAEMVVRTWPGPEAPVWN